ncbi:MAG TPA: hypothetical protein VJH88_05290 [Candidatus Nanoarchaeia archaeon]|nr:hypothetical protein [Candidatus Nanoarchaeia archaeon]
MARFYFFYYFGILVLFFGLLYLNIGHVIHHGTDVIELQDVIPHVAVGLMVTAIGLGIMITSNKRMVTAGI